MKPVASRAPCQICSMLAPVRSSMPMRALASGFSLTGRGSAFWIASISDIASGVAPAMVTVPPPSSTASRVRSSSQAPAVSNLPTPERSMASAPPAGSFSAARSRSRPTDWRTTQSPPATSVAPPSRRSRRNVAAFRATAVDGTVRWLLGGVLI